MNIRRNIFMLLCILVFSMQVKAQKVYIPDVNFRAFLVTNFPACMAIDSLDPACPAVLSATSLNVSSKQISDLTGLESFTSLQTLNCNINKLTSLPLLPASLTSLACVFNQLTSLPVLPASLTNLNCSQNQLSVLPVLPGSLTVLNCSNNPLNNLPASLPNSLTSLTCQSNKLTSLPALPATLTYLNCATNQLTSLPALPAGLTSLFCNDNQITSLPVLPLGLVNLYCYNNLLTSLPALPDPIQYLFCYGNQLTALPALPASLITIECYSNQLTSLPALPSSLVNLYCYSNQLTNLPALPASLTYLECHINLLTSLPALPAGLIFLFCHTNQLTSLPALPAGLTYLNCVNNQLTSLPALPASLPKIFCSVNLLTSLPVLPAALKQLDCSSNQLTSLPVLPAGLTELLCSTNQISCFPSFPNTLISKAGFSISGNPAICLPNYVAAMNAVALAMPLCVDNDPVNNPFGCMGSSGIMGYTYIDNNADCLFNGVEQPVKNIPVQLYDKHNNLVGQYSSLSNGVYDFTEPADTFNVKIDTTGLPFTVPCGNPQNVITTVAAPLASGVNFAIACKPGFDIGVRSIAETGRVFPGQGHCLKISAGDLTRFYNLNCPAAISGQIVVTVTGPVTYKGPAAGALTPTSVVGNVFTYSIADFSLVNNDKDFQLLFTTNMNALKGDPICATVNVTPTAGDNNNANNISTLCYTVVNSFDPNMKEVYPTEAAPGYMDWFTYTIHFQNTGNAPAITIRLEDTLDVNLDYTTFQVVNYSHDNSSKLIGNHLTFIFPNIMLPDSASDEPGSKGFVQYRIKPKANLSLGTEIKNTATIYFDFNTTVATNTAVSTIKNPVITAVSTLSEHAVISVYPNPTNNNILLRSTSDLGLITICNSLGEIIYSQITNETQQQIDLSKQASGVYFLQITPIAIGAGNAIQRTKIVKE